MRKRMLLETGLKDRHFTYMDVETIEGDALFVRVVEIGPGPVTPERWDKYVGRRIHARTVGPGLWPIFDDSERLPWTPNEVKVL